MKSWMKWGAAALVVVVAFACFILFNDYRQR